MSQDDDLAARRAAIDRIDDAILAALGERARHAQAIGHLKAGAGGRAWRPEREAQVVDRLVAANPGPLTSEHVARIVMMLRGGNAKQVVSRVKARVKEINEQQILPGGLQIVPFYDRSQLVDAALWTVTKVLIEGIVLVVIVLFVFLGDIRSSLIVVATLCLGDLTKLGNATATPSSTITP